MPTKVPTPKQVEAFLAKVQKWGTALPAPERDLLAHLIASSNGFRVRPRVSDDGFWAQWSQRQY